jgi:hypothetical protein
MSIESSKLELVRYILDSQNDALINEIRALFKKNSSNNSEFTPAQIEEIKLGLEQLNNGDRISFQDYLNRKK